MFLWRDVAQLNDDVELGRIPSVQGIEISGKHFAKATKEK